MLIGKPSNKDLEKCWLHGKEYFLKKLAKDQHAPFDFSQLEFRFIDMNGKRYYAYPKNIPKPIERLGQEMDFLSWLSAGLSGDEIEKLMDVADNALLNGIKTGKNASAIGAAINEVKRRKLMILHTELLYNIVAVLWIREDENPLVYNNQIQMEKVGQFKKEVAEVGSYFFFRKTEYEKLSYLWSLTEKEWSQYWTDSLTRQEALPGVLEAISSVIELPKEKKIPGKQ